MAERLHTGEKVYRGIPVSAGVCRGKILVLDKPRQSIEKRVLAEADVPGELNRLQQALLKTREQLQEVQRQLTQSLGAGQASIFDAHLLVLEDPSVIDEVVRVIQQDKVNAEAAFHQVTDRYIGALAKVEDEFLRERATDMRDVSGRVMNNLLGVNEQVDLSKLTEPCIIIAHDLTPSKTAQMDRKFVLGFATDIGSRTSHTAIMARSLRIPAIVGLKTASETLTNGEYALLDGYNGNIVVNPTDQTLFEYGQLVRKQVSLEEKLRDALNQHAVTLDNHRVFISANIEQAGDIELGALGVGLDLSPYYGHCLALDLDAAALHRVFQDVVRWLARHRRR